jgi:hypothetical protein
MKKLVTAVVATAAVLIPMSAQADDAKVPSTTIIKVMPGQGHVFQVGDPIRICIMAKTEWRVEHSVTLVIEQKPVGGKWNEVITFIGSPNTMGCLYGVVKSGGDSYMRARTIANSKISGSTSRKVFIDAA